MLNFPGRLAGDPGGFADRMACLLAPWSRGAPSAQGSPPAFEDVPAGRRRFRHDRRQTLTSARSTR